MNKPIASRNGQALVETLLITVFLAFVVFAALQLCLVALNDLLSNEAAFAAVRAGIVAKTEDAEPAMRRAAGAVLFLSAAATRFNYQVLGVGDVRQQPGTGHGESPVTASTLQLRYATRIMFAGLLGTGPQFENTARARMVRSPDEEYFERAYPGAPRFSP